MSKKVVCFGCGDFGNYFVETYGSHIIIEYFLDNGSSSEKMFCGYERFVPSKELCRGKLIIVTNIKHYKEIAGQLKGYGLKEKENFISILDFEKRYPTIRSGFQTVKCWFVDFWAGFDPYNNIFLRLLKRYYNIIVDNQNPDFLFCSVFYEQGDCKALLYQCPRIFYTGENLIPDFNIYDYAIGFAYMDYEDRYLRWPLYRLYSEFELAKRKHHEYRIDDFMKRDFCCRVVSAPDAQYRERLFDELNAKKYVASGGKCKNNLPDGCVEDKHQFLLGYKFNLAAENSNTSGYITEKIVQAWAAGCIPVYWGGAGTISREFNKSAFIDCSDFATISDVVDYLLQLENDKEALRTILRAPILLKDSEEDEKKLEMFLKNIFEKPENERIQRLSAVSRAAKRHERMYGENFKDERNSSYYM